MMVGSIVVKFYRRIVGKNWVRNGLGVMVNLGFFFVKEIIIRKKLVN